MKTTEFPYFSQEIITAATYMVKKKHKKNEARSRMKRLNWMTIATSSKLKTAARCCC